MTWCRIHARPLEAEKCRYCAGTDTVDVLLSRIEPGVYRVFINGDFVGGVWKDVRNVVRFTKHGRSNKVNPRRDVTFWRAMGAPDERFDARSEAVADMVRRYAGGDAA